MRAGGATDFILNGAYTVHARVKVSLVPGYGVEDATVFLHDHLGFDPFISATWTHSMDNASASGSVTLHLGLDEFSLSPLKNDAPANNFGPLLAAGTAIELHTACVPTGDTPGEGDWRNVINGWIDRVTITDAETVTCEFRDPAGFLMNLQVEEGSAQGSDAGTGVVAVMAQILLAWGPPFPFAGPIPLYYQIQEPVASGWFIKKYWQEPMPVWEALRRLALQIGWDLRFRHGPTDLGCMLPFFVDPDRYRTNDHTLDESGIDAIESVAINADDVRNVIEVRYPLATGEPLTEPVIVEDADSIAKYGRRYMRIVEDKQSNIDTLEEATTLANAVLADLKEPLAEQSVTMPYFWPVELNDMWGVNGGVVYDPAGIRLAVVSFTHTLENGTGTTKVTGRGTPLAAHREWQRGRLRNVLVGTTAPTGTAPEGAFWCQVSSLSIA